MPSYHNIYVAASSQHVGKTTSTLGLVRALSRRGINVGYCKPVGQRFVDVAAGRADKDAVLFSEVMGFDLKPNLHSPVILGPGATADFLEHPEWAHYDQRVQYASRELANRHDVVIYEGTGHPGVGAVVDLSNARVAKMLDASVILVVEGGIGSTIDMLALCLSRFEEEEVRIAGVIINKVRPDRLAKVQTYVQRWLNDRHVPLLGMLPYDESMGYPIMKMVAEAVEGVTIYNEKHLSNKVQEIVAGSLLDVDSFKSSNVLLVASAVRVDHAIEKVLHLSNQKGLAESPLSGIIATGVGAIGRTCIDYVREYNIPMVRTALDTYGSVLKVSRIEVKINERTPWKVNRAIELIEQHVDLDRLLASVTK
jgi:BioD-like phosphotransacetylase family protein